MRTVLMPAQRLVTCAQQQHTQAFRGEVAEVLGRDEALAVLVNELVGLGAAQEAAQLELATQRGRLGNLGLKRLGTGDMKALRPGAGHKTFNADAQSELSSCRAKGQNKVR